MDEFSVTPLGTVSPYPKGNKNCPGFLVKNDDKKILLDCGNGISRLMNFPKDLKDLIIIISHLHKDHYSDLGAFADALDCYHRLGISNDTIKVFLPEFWSVAFNYNNVIDILASSKYMKLIDYGEQGYVKVSSTSYLHNNLVYGNMKLSFLKNLHGTPNIKTYSTKIEVNGMSLVYTADTEYNEQLIEFCKNADLLISEATFLKGQPKTKGHMYAYEAGFLAKEANVKKLMLTHFWPEIPKSEYVNEASIYFENVIAAEEGKKLILRRD